MKEENLLADIGPSIVFLLATLVFGMGWLNTGRTLFLAATILLGIVTLYQVYRLRRVYLE